MHDACEEVEATPVGTKPMHRVWRHVECREVGIRVVERRNQGTNDGQEDEREQDAQTDHRAPLAHEAPDQ